MSVHPPWWSSVKKERLSKGSVTETVTWTTVKVLAKLLY